MADDIYEASERFDELFVSLEGAQEEVYDVVGPICESSDVFAKDYSMNATKRGDLLALRSAGAYGEIMASQYNCRTLPIGYSKEDIL